MSKQIHPALIFEADLFDVGNQSFRLIQGNGCSLKIISDADGDSQFTRDQLVEFANGIRDFLNAGEDERDQTIAFLSQQLADKREIIRRLTA